MTAPQRHTGPIPWRVKVKGKGATWFSPAMTEEEAVAEAARMANALSVVVGDTAALVRFPTRYGVDAWLRGRDITAIEPIGPRWDGVDDNRPADPTPAPATELTRPGPPSEVGADEPDVPNGGTDWLRHQQKHRPGRRTR